MQVLWGVIMLASLCLLLYSKRRLTTTLPGHLWAWSKRTLILPPHVLVRSHARVFYQVPAISRRPYTPRDCRSGAVPGSDVLVRPPTYVSHPLTLTSLICFSMTLWYPRYMLQYRIAMFEGGATLAGEHISRSFRQRRSQSLYVGAFSGLFAYGISFMSGTAGLLGWSWIFVSGQQQSYEARCSCTPGDS